MHEGESGVLRILRSLVRNSPAATRVISRDTRIPVPVVAAIQNQLRSAGLLSRERPSRLTDAGRALAGTLSLLVDLPPALTQQDARGNGSALTADIPSELAGVVAELEQILLSGPEVDVTLDQSYATAATKVSRVLLMLRTGGLPAPALLAIGDDDLISVAVTKVGQALGVPLVRRILVVDISSEILSAVADHATGGPELVLVQHDLREPLPERVRGQATVAMTDPPYTAPGARLFLSRAIEGLRPGPGRDLYFHFGPKGPDAGLEIDRVLVELGLQTSSLAPAFNEYLGSGVLGGVGSARHLYTTTATRASFAHVTMSGPLYTADIRQSAREFRCLSCGRTEAVGPGQQWTTIGQLKQRGCPTCDGHSFAPGQLIGGGPGGPPR